MNIPSVKSNFETYVILIASMTVMYAFAVWKLHGPDSHRIPFLSQMIPTTERTATRNIISLIRQSPKIRTVNVGRTWADDDILEYGPLPH